MVIFSLLFIPTLITLFYGEQYTSSIFLAGIFIFSLLFSFPSNFLIAVLSGLRKTKEISHSNLFSGIFQICSLLILTPILGTLGVVISRVITNWITFFIQWYLTSKSLMST